MSKDVISVVRKHPFANYRQKSHGHFQDAQLKCPEFSIPVVPFRWILRDETKRHDTIGLHGIAFNEELEPKEKRNGAGNTNGWRIGIIAPYRAQASLIDKLVGAWRGKPACVEIQTGTIHGFQGDECDIVLAVFNPPPNISKDTKDTRMFLHKRNILNVAISRARDYLFMLMPDNSTVDVGNLRKIKRIEHLFTDTGECVEFATKAIEETLFDNANYLEENTFATTHQLANVYGRPEKRYEVRSDENAVDVQILEQ